MITAIVSATRRRRRMRGNLSVAAGSFLVCDTGVTARLEPPLQILSNHLPWKYVPPSLAALKIVTLVGEGPFADLFYSMLNDRQARLLEKKIGFANLVYVDGGVSHVEFVNSEMGESIRMIWEWMPTLASRCPCRRVAREIGGLKYMSDTELCGYASQRLL